METFDGTEDDAESDLAGRRMYEAVTAGDADEVRRILAEHPKQLMDFPGVASSWLHYAANEAQSGVIDVLLEAGLDVNWGRRDRGDTPLVGSVNKGHYETAKYLLSLGANPNLGRCLIAALNSKVNSFELVKLLVEHGVDVNQVWRFGDEERGPLFNALSWAIDGENEDIAAYLRAHGAVMPPREETPSYSSAREEIIAYFEQRFGRVDPHALLEIVPTSDPPVAIQRIRRTDGHSVILFTTGMSDQPMVVPKGAEEYRYAELLMELPGDWPLSGEALADPKHRWPIDWLRRAAAYPRSERAWLGAPVAIMANGDPPAPLAPGCQFAAMLLGAGYDDVGPITLADGRVIQIYTLLPLYADEHDLERKEGLPELFRRLDQFEVGRRIDLGRQSVASYPGATFGNG